MAQIPIKDELIWALEHPAIEEMPRDYLGMSMIGEPCDRYLQYYFRWADTIRIDRRIRRLFDFGHIAEAQMTKELERVGCVINGQQKEYIGFGGHWKGHIDGDIMLVPGKGDTDIFLLEFKTHNHKFFKILKKKGVQVGFPKHYDQCQRYLAEDLLLSGAMYIGYNKDDSDFYIEFIDHDPARQKELKLKEQHILVEPTLFPRIGTGQATWHECKMCNMNKVCYGKKGIKKTCRSCKYVDIDVGGAFICTNTRIDGIDRMQLGVDKQEKGCEAYELDEVFFKSD